MDKKTYLLRVASAPKPMIGGGHVSRCLNLAKSIQGKAVFCLDHDGDKWEEHIRSLGYDVIYQGDEDGIYDVIIMDGYEFTDDDRSYYKTLTNNLWIFDDKGEVFNYADGLICTAVPKEALPSFQGDIISGLQYGMVDQTYSQMPDPEIKDEIKNITITFGRKDPKQVIVPLVKELNKFNIDAIVQIILDDDVGHIDEVKALSFDSKMDIRLLSNLQGLASVFSETDIMICSGGVTALESCAAGIPTLTLPIDKGTSYQSIMLEAEEAIVNIESLASFSSGFSKMQPIDKRQTMSKNARALIDGKGAKRLVEKIELLTVTENTA